MSPGRIWAVVRKDWAELRRERALIATTAGVPLFLVGIFLLLAVLAPELEDPELPDPRLLEELFPGAVGFSGLGAGAIAQVLLLRQLVLLLLIVPEFATMAIATYSIVGEKRARSLEPLLASPITTAELLTAKCLTAGIPGVALTWLSFGLAAAVLVVLTSPEVLRLVVNVSSVLLVVVVAPLVGLLALSLGVIASARSSDARTAQQIGVVVVIPLVGLLLLQLQGTYLLTPGRILLGAAVLAAVDLTVLRVGVSLFQRETILTRWR